ncbi:hypothetical protein TNIN_114721 [Trichonephila inaurata madagascariensis]|uniref:Uncharacterized protein n=1 Tax=Trichonephila inaurata madagascariensis TaxID=2747483 RepID=A0A8X7C522_9ARAC|nr:hypothetical protein TNIN_114721 [Trichonephila inaurata madagascariensis]
MSKRMSTKRGVSKEMSQMQYFGVENEVTWFLIGKLSEILRVVHEKKKSDDDCCRNCLLCGLCTALCCWCCSD